MYKRQAFVDVVNTVDGLRLADRVSLLAVLLADHIAFIETCAVYKETAVICLVTVSYTHLDVYKRQAIPLSPPLFPFQGGITTPTKR